MISHLTVFGCFNKITPIVWCWTTHHKIQIEPSYKYTEFCSIPFYNVHTMSWYVFSVFYSIFSFQVSFINGKISEFSRCFEMIRL